MSECIVLCEIKDEYRKSNYKITNEFTNHAVNRKNRIKIVSSEANPAYYFEVHRTCDSSKQIHCILEDATLLVFNKKSFKLITIIIANNKTLKKYYNKIDKSTSIYEKVYRSALVNEAYRADNINNSFMINNADLFNLKAEKNEIINS